MLDLGFFPFHVKISAFIEYLLRIFFTILASFVDSGLSLWSTMKNFDEIFFLIE